MMFDYARNGYLNSKLNGTSISFPLSKVALLREMPTASTSYSDISEPNPLNGYARVDAGTNWTAPVNGVSTNSTTLTFPEATGSWDTILGVAIMTANDNLLFYGPLRAPLVIDESSPVVSFPPGSIIVSVSGGLGTIAQNNILSSFLRQVTGGGASTYYLGLSSTMPESDGSGWNEPAIGINNYRRAQLANVLYWNNPVVTGFAYNRKKIYMPSVGTPSGIWSADPLVAFGLWDSATFGNLYFFGAIASPVLVNLATSIIIFEPGELQIRLT